jgi:hypothetical protein
MLLLTSIFVKKINEHIHYNYFFITLLLDIKLYQLNVILIHQEVKERHHQQIFQSIIFI